MNIRCAEIADFDNVVSFYKCVIEKTPEIEKYARWVYGQHPTDAMILNYIEQGAMYLLEEEQMIIGAMAVTMSQSDDYHCINWSTDAADDEVAVIHILCVNPDYQKQSIGKRMIRESAIIAEREMKKAVRLDALASNTPAQRMYQSLGFECRGKQHLYAENTGWTDFLFFECAVEHLRDKLEVDGGLMYSGLIIKESIVNEQILDKLDVVSVELWNTDNKPKYWTAISFTSNYEDFPRHLSSSLASSSESGMVWYVDIKDAVYKYIVLNDVVLKYHLGNEEEKKLVCERCIELGVKREQLDWLE